MWRRDCDVIINSLPESSKLFKHGQVDNKTLRYHTKTLSLFYHPHRHYVKSDVGKWFSCHIIFD